MPSLLDILIRLYGPVYQQNRLLFQHVLGLSHSILFELSSAFVYGESIFAESLRLFWTDPYGRLIWRPILYFKKIDLEIPLTNSVGFSYKLV